MLSSKTIKYGFSSPDVLTITGIFFCIGLGSRFLHNHDWEKYFKGETQILMIAEYFCEGNVHVCPFLI